MANQHFVSFHSVFEYAQLWIVRKAGDMKTLLAIIKFSLSRSFARSYFIVYSSVRHSFTLLLSECSEFIRRFPQRNNNHSISLLPFASFVERTILLRLPHVGFRLHSTHNNQSTACSLVDVIKSRAFKPLHLAFFFCWNYYEELFFFFSPRLQESQSRMCISPEKWTIQFRFFLLLFSSTFQHPAPLSNRMEGISNWNLLFFFLFKFMRWEKRASGQKMRWYLPSFNQFADFSFRFVICFYSKRRFNICFLIRI